MALLTSGELDALARIVLDSGKAPSNMTKDATRTIASALNDFLDTNAAALNSAIPQPERGLATTRFKQALGGIVLLGQAGLIDSAAALRTIIKEF